MRNRRCRVVCGHYHEDRLTVAKHKINRAFNVTVLEVMTTNVITKSILATIESTIVESCHVGRDSECCPLLSNCSGWWWGCCVLQFEILIFQKQELASIEKTAFKQGRSALCKLQTFKTYEKQARTESPLYKERNSAQCVEVLKVRI